MSSLLSAGGFRPRPVAKSEPPDNSSTVAAAAAAVAAAQTASWTATKKKFVPSRSTSPVPGKVDPSPPPQPLREDAMNCNGAVRGDDFACVGNHGSSGRGSKDSGSPVSCGSPRDRGSLMSSQGKDTDIPKDPMRSESQIRVAISDNLKSLNQALDSFVDVQSNIRRQIKSIDTDSQDVESVLDHTRDLWKQMAISLHRDDQMFLDVLEDIKANVKMTHKGVDVVLEELLEDDETTGINLAEQAIVIVNAQNEQPQDRCVSNTELASTEIHTARSSVSKSSGSKRASGKNCLLVPGGICGFELPNSEESSIRHNSLCTLGSSKSTSTRRRRSDQPMSQSQGSYDHHHRHSHNAIQSVSANTEAETVAGRQKAERKSETRRSFALALL